MTETEESTSAMRKYHEQMLKLVAKGFYNELIYYGVEKADVLSVAGHLLDNVMVKGPTNKLVDYYNRLFTIKDVNNDWAAAKTLTLQQVTITPMDPSLIPQIGTWLQTPAIRESFYPRFPESGEELSRYFMAPAREYFS